MCRHIAAASFRRFRHRSLDFGGRWRAAPRPLGVLEGVRVVALNVYPVKSCLGIALQTAVVGPGGIEHDRPVRAMRAQQQQQQPALAYRCPLAPHAGHRVRFRPTASAQ